MVDFSAHLLTRRERADIITDRTEKAKRKERCGVVFFDKEDFAAAPVLAACGTWKAQSVCVEGRPFSALVYRVKGRAHFRFENGQELTSGEGELLYVPSGVGYRAEYTDSEIRLIHFTEYGKTPSPAETFPDLGGEILPGFFSRAVQLWQRHGTGFRAETTAVFYQILTELSGASMKGSASFGRSYSQALAHLEHSCFDPELRIFDVCRAAFISETAFRRCFGMQHGVSPVEYLTCLRLDRAELLLSSTDMTVTEVAAACGFRDPKYFSRLMQKKRGASPSAFRKKTFG